MSELQMFTISFKVFGTKSERALIIGLKTFSCSLRSDMCIDAHRYFTGVI